jgi:hypothetical protein
MVDAAVEHAKKVGAEQAFKDFTTDRTRSTRKDLYVVVADMKGNMLAHGANPKLVGKNNMEMKDANGVYFTAESVKVAQTRGQGWVCAQKGDVFSGRQTRWGKSQTPHSLDGRGEGNRAPGAHRHRHHEDGQRVTGP